MSWIVFFDGASASLVPLEELQSETACDVFGTSQRLAPAGDSLKLVQVLSEASLVPNNEMQSETASDDYGTSQRRLEPVVKFVF